MKHFLGNIFAPLHCTLAGVIMSKDRKSGAKIFSILPQRSASHPKSIIPVLSRSLDEVLGLGQCQRIYEHVQHETDTRRFIHLLLSRMNIQSEVSNSDRDHIPAKGPVVVIANHPFGGIEGLLLAELLLKVRPDVKIMANFLLSRIPQLRDCFISVDPFNRPGSARANIAPLRQAVNWVQDGGMLLVFPAGEVSHLTLSNREIADPAWNPAVAAIVRRTKAAVLPIFVHGRNRLSFQAAGLLHPRLRTALLVREFLNKRNRSIPIKIGASIPYRWFAHFTDRRQLLDYLRWRTYLLGYPSRSQTKMNLVPKLSKSSPMLPVASAQNKTALAREIAQLPDNQLLVRSGSYFVWQATAAQIPIAMQEIARLREISFRAASEGTGKPLDMDGFDNIYHHLFIWNEEASEIIGAYRLGATDHILERHGRQGLYTNTLFRSSMAFYRKLGPALEMGRSFIRPEYQKSYASLLLLWKGIGSFVSRNPRYRVLFGPVSISRDYSDLTRQLIATTLLRHCQAKDLAVMVRPRKPAVFKPIRVPGCNRVNQSMPVKDFKEVCSLIGDIELEPKEVPVLLRHYLNLGGQLLAFNIDRHFSDVMDGLIVVDLLKSDAKLLKRYMGKDGIAAFLNYHESSTNDPSDRFDTAKGRGLALA
jgi:putative hemolysin